MYRGLSTNRPTEPRRPRLPRTYGVVSSGKKPFAAPREAKRQVVTYDLPAGTKWQDDVTVQLPIRGKASVIRLYLPAEKAVVEVQSIQFLSMAGRKKAWDFAERSKQRNEK